MVTLIKKIDVPNIKWDMVYYLFMLINFRGDKRIMVTLIKK